MDVEIQIAKLIRRYFGKDDPYGRLLAVRHHFVELRAEGEVLGFLLYDEKKTHYEGLRSAVVKSAAASRSLSENRKPTAEKSLWPIFPLILVKYE